MPIWGTSSSVARPGSENADDIYFIWSHEHGLWWGPGGYVRSMTQARRFTRQKAMEICIKAVPGTANRMRALPELPVRQADAEAVRDAYLAAHPTQSGEWS